MTIQASGLNTYGSSGQISPPPPEVNSNPARASEKDDQGNGSITDRAELSDQALALSRNLSAAGSSSEQDQLKEGPLPPSQYQPGNGLPSSSINIHV